MAHGATSHVNIECEGEGETKSTFLSSKSLIFNVCGSTKHRNWVEDVCAMEVKE